MSSEHPQGRDFIREMEQEMASGTDYVTYAYASEEALDGPQMYPLHESFMNTRSGSSDTAATQSCINCLGKCRTNI
jgi:hypothetical protein